MPRHNLAVILAALCLATTLAGCTTVSEPPSIKVLEGDTPYDFQIRLTNEDPEGNLTASASDFKLVDANETVHPVSDQTYQSGLGFPMRVDLGPEQSAEGWLTFNQVGPGPWTLEYDGFGISTTKDLPFPASAR